MQPKIQFLDDQPNNLNLQPDYDPYDDPVVGHLRKLNTARQEMRQAESTHCLQEALKARINWRGEHPFQVGDTVLFYDLLQNKWCQGNIISLDSGIFVIKFGNSERRVHPRYMRPVSQTLDDLVVDPNNIVVTLDTVSRTMHKEHEAVLRNMSSEETGKTRKEDEQEVNRSTKQTGTQHPPENATAKGGAAEKPLPQPNRMATRGQEKQQTAKGGAAGSMQSADKSSGQQTGQTNRRPNPTIRYPINKPDYDWSADEYHSATEELPKETKKMPKKTEHEKARNPQKTVKITEEEREESAIRMEKIRSGELKIGPGWHKWQNLYIERPAYGWWIKLFLDTDPNYYYIGEYRGLSEDRERISLRVDGMKQKICVAGDSQPFWRYTTER